MSAEFIKVTQGDARNQSVNVKGIKPINNVKIIRADEESLSSETDTLSSYSDSEPRQKKTKKILRKREPPPQPPPRVSHREQTYDFSAFSNPKKVSREPQNYEESEYTESEAGDGEGSEGYSESESEGSPQGETFAQKQQAKQDLLIKIAALEKKGFEFTKKFTMASNYEEMMFEYTKVKKFIETQAGIKFARRCLMACVTGVEFLNKKFDPFAVKLEGWSENVMENVDDYDNVFERLYEKYSSKAEVAPEVELLLMVGGSAFMFHLTNSLLKGPDVGSLLAQNGGNQNFMASMMGAMNQSMKANNTYQPNQPPQRPNFPPPMDTRDIRKEMRGPSIDHNLFNGTPLASNYPQPPPPMNRPMQPMNRPNQPPPPVYYEDNPINDEDRFSVASSSDVSSISTISLGSRVKTIKKQTNKGVELNIR
jgi:hypothetical protein